MALRTAIASRIGTLLSAVLMLVGFAFPATAATGFYKDFVILTANKGDNSPVTNTYYYTNEPGGSGFGYFGGQNLGSFDRGRGELLLGAEANVYNDNGDATQNVQLLYRVYRAGTTAGAFSPLNLTLASRGEGGPNNSKYTSTTTNPNLLSATSGAGTYILEVSFLGTGTYNNSGGSGSFPFFDNNQNQGGNNYRASFIVTGSVPANWNGNSGDSNWFTSGNWSTNAVPDAMTDVVIPFVGANATYPQIDATATNAAPIATVRTLRIEPNTTSTNTGALLTLKGGQLQIYGDFADSFGGFTHSGGLFVLAGGDQSFDGGTQFRDVRIDGGGTKALNNSMTILSGATFSFANGKVTTKINSNINNYNITLQDGARLANESESSYIEGAVIATNNLSEGRSADFGNIGLEIFARSGTPGATVVTRVTNRIYTGVGTSTSIERGFYVNPNSNLPDVQSFDLTFRYLDNERNNIPTENLLLFRSVTSYAPFEGLGKTSTANKTLIRTNITGTLNATFTLGNSANPLPVTITSFTAAAQGADAVLNWATASETNNQGFEVQVSTDGTNFSKLGFLAVNNPNSTTPHAYQYRDVTTGKQGVRYYRLRQLDLDGTASFVGPRVVTFGGSVAQTTSLQGYPSPFSSEINLALQSTAAGLATVTITDGVGRQVRAWQPTVAAGASSLRLADLQNMPAGLYLVQVRYNDGQTQRLKMVKE